MLPSLRLVARSATYLGVMLCVRSEVSHAQQCAGDIRSEVLALEAVGDSLIQVGFPKQAANGPANPADTPRSRLRDALAKDGVYLSSLGNAGTAAGCIFDHRALYRSTFEAAIGDTSTLSEDDVKRAGRLAASAVLATRYSATDRVGVLFGFGMTALRKSDSRRFKVVALSEPPPAGAPEGTAATTVNYIVEESRSSLLPLALTGIAVRFRERDGAVRRAVTDRLEPTRSSADASNLSWWIDHALPTTVFGSVQLGAGTGDTGPVNGTALGLGWRVVGDVTLLFGYSVNRVKTVRRDILAAYLAAEGNKLELPAGESEATVSGTESASGWMFALGVPVSLQSVFGGGSGR
jgi:hypothetical protein